MLPPSGKKRLFRSAMEDAQTAKQRSEMPQCQSAAYELAFQDNDFLLLDELRPVRLQLELLKPELILNEHQVQSTVVIYGSARTKPPDDAAAHLADVKARIKKAGKQKTKNVKEGSDDPLQRELIQAKRDVNQSRYYQEARELAAMISKNTEENKLMVVTGGGPGIMEAANRGADDVGASSIGLNIVLPFEQRPNAYITPELCFQFHYFAIRKMHFLMRAKSLVAFPGGYGTMDELFETLTLIQTHKIKPIPVLLFGRDFWDQVINFDALIEQGTISPKDVDIFSYVESAGEAWESIKQANHV